MKAELIRPDGTRTELGGLSQFAQASEPGQGLFLLPDAGWLSVDLGPGQHRAQWMPADGGGPRDLELHRRRVGFAGGIDGGYVMGDVAYLPMA